VEESEFAQTVQNLKFKLGKTSILNWGKNKNFKITFDCSQQLEKLPK